MEVDQVEVGLSLGAEKGFGDSGGGDGFLPGRWVYHLQLLFYPFLLFLDPYLHQFLVADHSDQGRLPNVLTFFFLDLPHNFADSPHDPADPNSDSKLVHGYNREKWDDVEFPWIADGVAEGHQNLKHHDDTGDADGTNGQYFNDISILLGVHFSMFPDRIDPHHFNSSLDVGRLNFHLRFPSFILGIDFVLRGFSEFLLYFLQHHITEEEGDGEEADAKGNWPENDVIDVEAGHSICSYKQKLFQ